MAKTKKKSKKLLFILGGAVVILGIIAVVGKSAGWIGNKKALEVSMGDAEKGTIVEKVSASGTVQPVNEVSLSPDVSGEIIELTVEEGDSVFMDQLLVRIRPDNFINALERAQANYNQQLANLASSKANLSRAEATYNRQKLEYDRNKGLLEENVISDSDWLLAEQNFKVAQNDLESAKQNVKAAEYIVISSKASVDDAKENLRLTNVFSPVSGTVSKLNVKQGERVVGTQQMAGTEMLRIADLNNMEVRVDVNENDIIRVNIGDTTQIDVDSYSYMDKIFQGVVTHIANTAKDRTSPDAVTEFEVRIKILNQSYQDLIAEGNKTPFRPGMTASVDIVTEVKSDILIVPLSAVTTRKRSEIDEMNDPEKSRRSRRSRDEDNDEDESEGSESENKGIGATDDPDIEVVFVYDESGVAMVREVKTGISDYENIEILGGLESGEELITGPFSVVSQKLKSNDPVKSPEEKD